MLTHYWALLLAAYGQKQMAIDTRPLCCPRQREAARIGAAQNLGCFILHHAEVITLKGSSYRLRKTGIDTLPFARTENTPH